jgi:hypothetical protein
LFDSELFGFFFDYTWIRGQKSCFCHPIWVIESLKVCLQLLLT